MPRIFRTMKHDGGRPMVGGQRDMLGVRVPVEVELIAEGRVAPGKGMSVAPAWRDLPRGLIPRRFASVLYGNDRPRGPRGGGNDHCIWWMGEGPFVPAEISYGLRLRVTKSDHGQVEPAGVMPLEEFQGRLASTRDAWRLIDEDPAPPKKVGGPP